jgi:hypothetical protein
MLNRADGRDREAAYHKARVERLRNGIFPDDLVETTEESTVVAPQDVVLIEEATPARTAA